MRPNREASRVHSGAGYSVAMMPPASFQAVMPPAILARFFSPISTSVLDARADRTPEAQKTTMRLPRASSGLCTGPCRPTMNSRNPHGA